MTPVASPRGIYAVAVVFFFAGLIVSVQILGLVFALAGWGPVSLTNVRWSLPLLLVAFFLVLCGVHFLVRMRRLPQWLLFAMTVILMIELAIAPAAGSPFYSPGRVYLNRALLLLPLVASCAYLLTPRVRAITRW
jgi:hypothetical protein